MVWLLSSLAAWWELCNLKWRNCFPKWPQDGWGASICFPYNASYRGPKITSVAQNSIWRSKSYICWPWWMGGSMIDRKLFLLPLMQDGGQKVISVACDSRWGSKSYICCLWWMQDGGPKVISVACDARWRSKSYICCLWCKRAVQKLYLLPVIQDGGPKVISVACDTR